MDKFPANETANAVDDKIASLTRKHQALEFKLTSLNNENSPNQLLIKRIKQEKLIIRERITKLRSANYPDDTA